MHVQTKWENLWGSLTMFMIYWKCSSLVVLSVGWESPWSWNCSRDAQILSSKQCAWLDWKRRRWYLRGRLWRILAPVTWNRGKATSPSAVQPIRERTVVDQQVSLPWTSKFHSHPKAARFVNGGKMGYVSITMRRILWDNTARVKKLSNIEIIGIMMEENEDWGFDDVEEASMPIPIGITQYYF